MKYVECDTITVEVYDDEELYFFVLTDHKTEENEACAVIKEDLQEEMSIEFFLRVCAIENNGNVKV